MDFQSTNFTVTVLAYYQVIIKKLEQLKYEPV